MVLEQWRRLPAALGQGNAGRQLALSESLLIGLDRPSLWWYSAGRPALVLGTSQKLQAVNLEYCRQHQIAVYRRTSGGAAVLSEPRFLSLDIALPPNHPFAPADIVKTYAWLGQTWLETLQTLGLSKVKLVVPEEIRAAKNLNLVAEEAEDDRLARLVCFGSLSPYEVVSEGRKLVGLAQVRRRAGTLLQCGLPFSSQTQAFAPLLKLLPSESSLLSRLLSERITSLDLASGREISYEQVMEAFEQSLQRLWQVQPVAADWSSESLAQSERLESEKFIDLRQPIV